MSQLQDGALIAAMSREVPLERRLVVMPILDPEEQIGSASIDLRLGTEFIESRRAARAVIDPFGPDEDAPTEQQIETAVPLSESLVLHPGQFVLGSSLEFVCMPPHLSGQVLGRSSWARVGLVVATAVVVQPGFSGSLTLELGNIGTVPVLLYPGVRIAQLAVWELGDKAVHPYSLRQGKYQAPLGPRSSRLRLEESERSRIERIGRALKGEPL